MIILTIIDPSEFTRPLARPNPRLIGNVGERSLQFDPVFFNPEKDEWLVDDASDNNIIATFAGRTALRHGPVAVNPGAKLSWNTMVIQLDAGGHNIEDGVYDLSVSYAGSETTIRVRINETDLHLVSAWPDATTNELAARELAEAKAEIAEKSATIEKATARVAVLQNRIPLLEALLK
jgi:hypothetical protein